MSNGDILRREPIGVCGLITPWNWPINQIALKVIPALATGCTSVLKPSEVTPLNALLYAQMIDEAGFHARLAYERSFYIESMILYELRSR